MKRALEGKRERGRTAMRWTDSGVNRKANRIYIYIGKSYKQRTRRKRKYDNLTDEITIITKIS